MNQTITCNECSDNRTPVGRKNSDNGREYQNMYCIQSYNRDAERLYGWSVIQREINNMYSCMEAETSN
jgi:hypothetical protein